MGIRGDDARIQIQKLSDVDQIDKQRQETQRGEVGVIRGKAEIEREKKRTTSPETERPDKVLVRQSPFRKKKNRDEKKRKSDNPEGDDGQGGKADVGGALDIKG